MFRLIAFGCLMGVALAAAAQQAVRYVSDELAIVLRAGAGNEGASLGVLTSGARVEVLTAAADDANANGYARVRTADGREGWVLERYLKDAPIARERLQRAEAELAAAQQQQAAVRRELAEAQAELKKIKDENARLLRDFSRIADSPGASPAASAEVLKEAEQLRARIQQLEQERAALQSKTGVGTTEEQRTLLLGGVLVAGGVLLALLLHWLWPKRRWGDL